MKEIENVLIAIIVVFAWEYIFWFLSIVGGLIFMLILFYLPETSALILRKRQHFKEKVIDYEVQETFWTSLARPFKFITKPVVYVATTPYSLAFGFMYFVIASLPNQLSVHYRFASYQIGLSYLANGLGNAMGAILSGRLSDRALEKIEDPLKRVPEARLSPMWIGVLVLPIGELIYGWCVQLDAHFMATMTGLFLRKFINKDLDRCSLICVR